MEDLLITVCVMWAIALFIGLFSGIPSYVDGFEKEGATLILLGLFFPISGPVVLFFVTKNLIRKALK